MNANGSNQIPLTDLALPADTDPAWSPDGQKIAFTTCCLNGTLNYEIYVMNADGSDSVRLTNNPASDDRPAWGVGAAASPTPTATMSPTPTPTSPASLSPPPPPAPAELGNISPRLGVQTGNDVLI